MESSFISVFRTAAAGAPLASIENRMLLIGLDRTDYLNRTMVWPPD